MRLRAVLLHRLRHLHKLQRYRPMKSTLILVACLFASTTALAASERNPFEPVKTRGGKQVDSLPFVLPPPAPPPPSVKRAAPSPEAPATDSFSSADPAPAATPVSAPAKVKSRDPATRIQANCSLKTKSNIIAAPSFGGTVVLSLQITGGRECLSAVLAEQRWLEVKDLSDPSNVQLLVDPNDSELPRQSNIILANAAQSVTIVLMQEGRVARGR